MDRRTNTSDGSGGASPTVVTERHDDDDLMADTDESTQILGTSSVQTATKPTKAAQQASANGSSTADEKDAAGADVPALPADSIGSPRDSSAFSQSGPAPISPSADDDLASADHGTHSPAADPSRRRTSPRRSSPVPAGRPAAGSPPEIRRKLIRRRPSYPPRRPGPFPRPRSCGIRPSRPRPRPRPGTSCARAPTLLLRHGRRPSAWARLRLRPARAPRRLREWRRPLGRGSGDRPGAPRVRPI